MGPPLVALLSAILSALWLLYGRVALAGARRMRLLAEVLKEADPGAAGGVDGASLPSLSVIVTARDEAASIETTVRRLLAQEYPGLEVVAVDDRSTDGTSGILDRLAAEGASAGRLSVIHVRDLPAGWLGKCHACRAGARRSRGEWLLFSDGDVTLASPDLLARVVAHAVRCGLDHVAVAPDTRPMTPLQAGLVAVFGQMFLAAARAHEMERDLPRGGAGVGAFNLVRRAAYERIGGHERLRLDPTDDFVLGRLLKESGARQRIYSGLGLVLCRWQHGTLDTIRGLEKNFFPGCGYSLGAALLLTTLLLGLTFAPPALALAAGLPAAPPQTAPAAGLPAAALAWLPLALEAGILSAGYLLHARRFGVGAWIGLLHPVSVLLLVAALWNSALRILVRGGVTWRGTFYPLAELRRGTVRRGAGRR